MRSHVVFRAALGILLVRSTTMFAQAARVDVVPHDADRRVDIVVDGKPFTSYIYPTTVMKPVLFPLRTADGIVVTRGFPLEPRPGERVDHPHHVGLWLNHSNVNGLDFWNNSYAIPEKDRPHMGTVLHRAITKAQGGAGEGVLEVTSDWVKPDGKPLLRESTRFVFHAAPNVRAIDRITTLTAVDTTVTFHDNKDGMLGLRVRRELEQPADKPETFTDAAGRPTTVKVLDNKGVTGKYVSSEGKEGDAVWSTRGKWTLLGGTVEGEPVTLAILDHPSNPGYPTHWHARGYGLFAANPLGDKELGDPKAFNFALEPGKSVTFKYRVLILSAAPSRDRIERESAAFAKE
jgi:hypothetical protein